MRLQTAAGLDVMMMLSVVFAAVRLDLQLTEAEQIALDQLCAPWREQIVRPLRAIRVQLKAGPAPAPSAGTEALRNQIKASELAAERLQASLVASFLATCRSDIEAEPAAPISADRLVELLGGLVERAASAQGRALTPDYRHDIWLIAQAAISA